MKTHIRLAAIGAASVLLLAACGGESSSRTKNSALCYATQEEKDAAVQAAQDAFDAAMGGAPTDDSISPTDSTVVTDSTVAPEESDVVTDSTSATGGGYRRPAVRAASSGDTTVPPAGDGGSEGEGEGDGTLTPEQQQAQMDLEAAESQPLCEEGAESVQLTTVECTGTIEGEVTNVITSDDCPDGVLYTSTSVDGSIWLLVKNGLTTQDPDAVMAQGPVDFSSLSPETPISIEISYEVEGSSDSQEESDAESEYEFSGVFAPGDYYFHEPRQGEDTVITATTNASCEESPFSLEWYKFNGVSFDYSSTEYGSNENVADGDEHCIYDYLDTYSDAYIVKVVSEVPVQWGANVDFRESSEDEIAGEEIDTPFEYSFESEEVGFDFELTEGAIVRFTANTFMSCERRNEIVPDPEIYLYEGAFLYADGYLTNADNNFSNSESNCSAAEVIADLDAGVYSIVFENDDFENPSERGQITIRSSVELTPFQISWDGINSIAETVNPPKAFTISIPAGGATLVATANSNNSAQQCDDDENYVDPYLVLVNLETGAMRTSDDTGETFGLPCLSSYMLADLDEGNYLLIATTYEEVEYDGVYEDGAVLRPYDLEFGVSGAEKPEDVVLVESNEPIPAVDIPAPPALPVGQLVEPGSKSTIEIADGVTSMLCTADCIEELFASVDPSVSTLQVNVGGRTVEVKRNAKKGAVVAVEAGSRSISVATIADDGTVTDVLTGQVQMGEPEVLVSEDSSSEGSSMNMILIIVLGLIVVGGAGAYVLRKRSATK